MIEAMTKEDLAFNKEVSDMVKDFLNEASKKLNDIFKTNGEVTPKDVKLILGLEGKRWN